MSGSHCSKFSCNIACKFLSFINQNFIFIFINACRQFQARMSFVIMPKELPEGTVSDDCVKVHVAVSSLIFPFHLFAVLNSLLVLVLALRPGHYVCHLKGTPMK